jgi:hypothetical protein
MAIRFEIENPDGRREFIVDMSISGIITVGRKAGLDMREFNRITDYTDYIEDEMILESENIQKLLTFCRSMLDTLTQLERGGTVLLSSTEEIGYKRMTDVSRASPPSRSEFAGTIPTLRKLIELCEKALAVRGSIVMTP